MITQQQKIKILQIINVFETGTPEGKYDDLVVYDDGKNGSKQITFGRSQTTEQGNLKSLIELYIQKDGSFKNDFIPYLPKIGKTPLWENRTFKELLKKSAREDMLMRTAQDDFFDTIYYLPAQIFFEGNKFTLPLSMLVIYDSYIHSGSVPSFLRNRFPEAPPVRGGDEKAWIKAYVNARHNWLANHSKKLLQLTKYRTQCFLNQIKNDNWDLSQTVTANGVKVQ